MENLQLILSIFHGKGLPFADTYRPLWNGKLAVDFVLALDFDLVLSLAVDFDFV